MLYYWQYKRYFHLETLLKATVTCEFLFLPMVERISHFRAWSFFPLCWGKSGMTLVKPVWSNEANGNDGAPCTSWSECPWLWPGRSAYTCQHYTEEPSALLKRGHLGEYIFKRRYAYRNWKNKLHDVRSWERADCPIWATSYSDIPRNHSIKRDLFKSKREWTRIKDSGATQHRS